MLNLSLLLLVLGPILFGFLALLAPDRTTRTALVVANALVTPLAAMALVYARHDGAIVELPGTLPTLFEWGAIAMVILIGRQIERPLVVGFGVIQGILALAAEFLHKPAAVAAPAFIIDPLSLIMVMIISVVGSLITVYGLGYMDTHEHHGPATQGGPGRFFFFLVGFLGAMNGLVLANDLRWLSVFWELTTICSFMLIGHDGSDDARASAERAILINLFGGTALMIGQVVALWNHQGETLAALTSGRAIVPIAFFLLAAFTKSAQLPFQSWLLGAMVAPTPVSALLHSSTMVKAGVYLVLRLTPGFVDSRLATVTALAGAFTFMMTNMLAISQSNGKKVLAYSTIANLGLIIACGSINSPLAYAAAVMLLIFHAVAKALLFICMGTIEQAIGSRDIEEQHGLMHRMPFTTVIMVIGMGAMLLPPFGILIGKWLAMEATVRMPLVMVLVVLGNACAVVVWCKWLGRLLTASYHQQYKIEPLPVTMSLPQLLLATMTLTSAIGAIPTFTRLAEPLASKAFQLVPQRESSVRLLGMVKDFLTWPLLSLFLVVAIAVVLAVRTIDRKHVRQPFLCGENIDGSKLSYEFRGPMEKGTTAMVRGYYLRGALGEESLTIFANPIAFALLLTMFGVIGV